jgi:hypothetical protein
MAQKVCDFTVLHTACSQPFTNIVLWCAVAVTVQREKEASGLADVPGGSKGKLLEVEYAFTEDKKLRGQLRDPSAIEAQVGSGSGLGRIGRGTGPR